MRFSTSAGVARVSIRLSMSAMEALRRASVFQKSSRESATASATAPRLPMVRALPTCRMDSKGSSLGSSYMESFFQLMWEGCGGGPAKEPPPRLKSDAGSCASESLLFRGLDGFEQVGESLRQRVAFAANRHFMN